MYDRPDLSEMLEAVATHLEHNIKDAVRHDRKLYFQTLVALNLLKIARREIELSHTHKITEWQRLNELQGQDIPFPDAEHDINRHIDLRRQQLCMDIRAGHFDEKTRWQTLLSQLLASAHQQLEVTNPDFLARLGAERAGYY
jgi:hypothetical protein